MMIRLVTYTNFPVLDAQIERACRRHRRISRSVVLLDDINEFSVLRSIGDARRSSRIWLRNLARAVDALDGERSRKNRKPCRLVAANATRAEPRGARRRRANRA
jgi:predicted RNA-binding protein with PIN domain